MKTRVPRSVGLALLVCMVAGLLPFAPRLNGESQQGIAVSDRPTNARYARDVLVARAKAQDTATQIDGSVTPHLVPTELAYQAFLRAFATRAPADQRRAESYLRYAVSTGSECCPPDPDAAAGDHQAHNLSAAEISVLISAAAVFSQRVAEIEGRAAAIRRASALSEATRGELRQLDSARTDAAMTTMATLRAQLSPLRMRQIEYFVANHVKAQMKVY